MNRTSKRRMQAEPTGSKGASLAGWFASLLRPWNDFAIPFQHRWLCTLLGREIFSYHRAQISHKMCEIRHGAKRLAFFCAGDPEGHAEHLSFARLGDLCSLPVVPRLPNHCRCNSHDRACMAWLLENNMAYIHGRLKAFLSAQASWDEIIFHVVSMPWKLS